MENEQLNCFGFFFHVDRLVSNYVTQAYGTLTSKIQFTPGLYILIRDKEIVPHINYVTKSSGTNIFCTADLHILIRDKEIVPYINYVTKASGTKIHCTPDLHIFNSR